MVATLDRGCFRNSYRFCRYSQRFCCLRQASSRGCLPVCSSLAPQRPDRISCRGRSHFERAKKIGNPPSPDTALSVPLDIGLSGRASSGAGVADQGIGLLFDSGPPFTYDHSALGCVRMQCFSLPPEIPGTIMKTWVSVRYLCSSRSRHPRRLFGPRNPKSRSSTPPQQPDTPTAGCRPHWR